ncbi:hypothetical protein [Nitrospira sp. Nam74]
MNTLNTVNATPRDDRSANAIDPMPNDLERVEFRAGMDMKSIGLKQRIEYWSPTTRTVQRGTVVWISPRRDLIAVQSGVETEFLKRAQLTYKPCAPASDEDFHRIPAADPQHRPDRERYLRVLASAYPDYCVCSLTALEGVRTSCRTGTRWRVFCQAAVLHHPHKGLLLDVEGDHVWYGAVMVMDLATLAGKPWSPYVGVPNQWDALDIPQQEMARIVSDAVDALTHHTVIPYPPAIVVETNGITGRVLGQGSSCHDSSSPDRHSCSRLE